MTKQLSIELLRQDLATLQGLTETEMSELFNNVKDLLAKLHDAEDQEKINAVKEELSDLEVLSAQADDFSAKFLELKCKDVSLYAQRRNSWSKMSRNEMYESIWSDFIDIAEACGIMKWPKSNRLEKFGEYIEAYVTPLLVYMKSERPQSAGYKPDQELYSDFMSVMKARCIKRIPTGSDHMDKCVQKMHDSLQ
jgi:hypothetical protein